MARDWGKGSIIMIKLMRSTIGAASFSLALAFVTMPLAAHSPQIVTQQAARAAPAVPQVPTTAPMRFDWRAKRATPAASSQPARRATAAPGRGSYICSAAGSGQMSHCVAR